MRLVTLAFILVLSGCTTTGPTLESTNSLSVSDKTELRLIEQSKKTLDELQSKGYLLKDEKLLNYLNNVGDRIVHEHAHNTIHMHILKSSTVNALALPDGSILFTIGLLTRLKNEAQLAFVMGHEAAHVIKKHSLVHTKSRKSNIIAAHITDLLLMGTSVAYLPFMASIASHSRQQEDEADIVGLKLLVNAGYDPEAALNFFDIINEVKSADSTMESFYNSHPTNQKRNEIIGDMISNEYFGIQGATAENDYILFRQPLLLHDVKLKLDSRHYQSALESAERAIENGQDLAIGHFYQGEALRLMGDDPETTAREHASLHNTEFNDKLIGEFTSRKTDFYRQALRSYRKALLISSSLSKAYRGMGLVHYKEGRRDQADENLRQYLKLEPNARDKRYVNYVMEKIGKL